MHLVLEPRALRGRRMRAREHRPEAADVLCDSVGVAGVDSYGLWGHAHLSQPCMVGLLRDAGG